MNITLKQSISSSRVTVTAENSGHNGFAYKHTCDYPSILDFVHFEPKMFKEWADGIPKRGPYAKLLKEEFGTSDPVEVLALFGNKDIPDQDLIWNDLTNMGGKRWTLNRDYLC